MAQEVIQATLEVSTNSLKALRAEIKGYREELEKAEIGTDAFDKASDKLAKAQNQLKNTLKLGKKEVSELDTSYEGLVRQMAELRDAWKKTSDVAERDALGKQIAGINTQLKDLDGSIGNFQRNVGDYEGKIVSASKKAGETLAKTVAPALQESVTLAFDWVESLGGLKELWKDIGGQVTSLVKQIGALKLGLLGIVAGAVIAGVIALYNAFKDTADAVKATVDKMTQFERTMSEVAAAGAKEVVEIRTLYEITQDLTASYEARLNAAAELQRQYPDYLGNLSTEQILAGEAADAYARLAANVENAAKAQAIMNRLVEIEEMKLSPEVKAFEKSTSTLDSAVGRRSRAFNTSGANVLRNPTLYAIEDEVTQWEVDRLKLQEVFGRSVTSFRGFIAELDAEREGLVEVLEGLLPSGGSSTYTPTTPGGSTFDVQGYLEGLRGAKRQREADTYVEEASLLEDRYLAEVDSATQRLELAKATEQEIAEAKLLIEEEYLRKRNELFAKYYGETAEAVAPALEQQTKLTFEAAAAEIRSGEVYDKTERDKQKTARKTGDVVKDVTTATMAISEAGAALFEENTIAHKAFSIAQAVMDTFRAANSILADTKEGPSWVRWVQAAATIGIGLANVRNILSTPTDGSIASVSGSATAVYNAPAVVQEVPVTRTVTGEAEEEQIRANNQTRVVLVYGDVEEAANRVQVQQSESSF
ncbi:MAG: hypothetical protein IJ998_01730 [Alistipes sp.]|nr:hypothetical protein [Alistipes sp.]